MGLFSKKDMEQQVEQQNQSPEVENARIVNFGGKDHVHIDYRNGDIGVIGKDGELHHIPVKTGKKG